MTRLSSVSPPSGRPLVTDSRSMSSEEEFDLVSANASFLEMDLAGGSGLTLLFSLVLEGEPLSEEVSSPSIKECSLGDAGASLGDSSGFSEKEDWEVGEVGLEIELRDSLLSCLL